MVKKIHFIGVGGSGISGAAELAKQFGFEVTGCDVEASTAYITGIQEGHSTGHLKNVDLVVASPSLFFSQDPIAEIEVAKKDKKLITWQEFAAKYLLRKKKVICIAGTHGKSTTTAMAGKLLEDAGLDPSVLVGAKVIDWSKNYRFGKGDYFVVEADEFYNNFLHYHPDIIILNNLEFDHPDYFKSESDVIESFRKFLGNLKSGCPLIVNWDDKGVRNLLTGDDFVGSFSKFDLIRIQPSKAQERFLLGIAGRHNFANALMVEALGRKLDFREDVIKNSLENFKGVGRRTELIGSANGIEVYDDYAHHPTAILATIQGIREIHPKARLWVVDEPHGYKRTKVLLENYKDVFAKADRVLIGPIYKARDEVDSGITPQLVAEKSGHIDAQGFNSFSQVLEVVISEVKEGDVILVMGAGKSYLWAKEIVKVL